MGQLTEPSNNGFDFAQKAKLLTSDGAMSMYV